MPLYEVMLFGDGAPELRLTDRALAVGDVVELGQTLWRVERSTAAGREDVERRFLLVPETPPADTEPSDSRGRSVNLLLPRSGTSPARP